MEKEPENLSEHPAHKEEGLEIKVSEELESGNVGKEEIQFSDKISNFKQNISKIQDDIRVLEEQKHKLDNQIYQEIKKEVGVPIIVIGYEASTYHYNRNEIKEILKDGRTKYILTNFYGNDREREEGSVRELIKEDLEELGINSESVDVSDYDTVNRGVPEIVISNAKYQNLPGIIKAFKLSSISSLDDLSDKGFLVDYKL